MRVFNTAQLQAVKKITKLTTKANVECQPIRTGFLLLEKVEQSESHHNPVEKVFHSMGEATKRPQEEHECFLLSPGVNIQSNQSG